MYESPVNVIYGEMQTQIEGDIFKAIQNVGIDVDKEELLKALQYDREQYSKGYSDGYAKAIDEFAERMSLEISESIIAGMLFDNRDNSSYDTADKIVDYAIDTSKKIAEQMKGGAE